jgi:hypothetical protein
MEARIITRFAESKKLNLPNAGNPETNYETQ